jgi:hypothetical protein
MNIKGFQVRPRVEWLKQAHPFTTISDVAEVHAKKTTPAMAMGLIDRPLAIAEILHSRSFHDFIL